MPLASFTGPKAVPALIAGYGGPSGANPESTWNLSTTLSNSGLSEAIGQGERFPNALAEAFRTVLEPVRHGCRFAQDPSILASLRGSGRETPASILESERCFRNALSAVAVNI